MKWFANWTRNLSWECFCFIKTVRVVARDTVLIWLCGLHKNFEFGSQAQLSVGEARVWAYSQNLRRMEYDGPRAKGLCFVKSYCGPGTLSGFIPRFENLWEYAGSRFMTLNLASPALYVFDAGTSSRRKPSVLLKIGNFGMRFLYRSSGVGSLWGPGPVSLRGSLVLILTVKRGFRLL